MSATRNSSIVPARITPCLRRRFVSFTGEVTARAPACVAGVDVSCRAGRYSIAATGRYLHLRRGNNTPTDLHIAVLAPTPDPE
jgi:hypothetical protein